MAFVPPHPTRDQEWDPVWILTFSPLGPESPFRPGKPGGPCGREGGNKRGNEFMAHSFIHLKTHGIGCSGHTIGPGGPSGPGDPGRPCSPWKKKSAIPSFPVTAALPAGNILIIHLCQGMCALAFHRRQKQKDLSSFHAQTSAGKETLWVMDNHPWRVAEDPRLQ